MDDTMIDKLLILFTVTISAATGVESFYYKLFFQIQHVNFYDPQSMFYIVSTVFVFARLVKFVWTFNKKKDNETI